MMYGWGPRMGGAGGWEWLILLLMAFFSLLVLVGVVLLVWWIARAASHGGRQGAHGGVMYGHEPQGRAPFGQGHGQDRGATEPAVAAVRERYARGEITREEYDEIMRGLGYGV